MGIHPFFKCEYIKNRLVDNFRYTLNIHKFGGIPLKLTDEQKYLMDNFGTLKVGDCKKCIKASEELGMRVTRTMNTCKSDICLMVSGLNWFRIKQKEELSRKSGTGTGKMVKTIEKANFVGICHEQLLPPWVIRYSDSTLDSEGNTKVSYMWYNTQTGVGGKGVYGGIETLGDIILCWKGTKPVNIEMYSTYCRDTNIFEGIEGVYLDTPISKIPIARGVNVGIAQTKDRSTGLTLTLIASRTGKVIGFPSQHILYIDKEENGGVMIQLEGGKFIRLASNFEIITRSKDLPVITIK